MSAAPLLRGCDVLPAMEGSDPRPPRQKGRAGTAGRFAVLNTFVDFTLRHLSRAEAGVWLVLYRDTKDGVARTSQADIAARVGTTPRHVRRAVSRLVAVGLLVVVRRGGLAKGPSRYRVLP